MIIGEALAYDQQFWADMGTMPDTVQDRFLAMAEQTPEFRVAQTVLGELAVSATRIASLLRGEIDLRLAAQTTETSVIGKVAVENERTQSQRTETPVLACEAIDAVQASIDRVFTEDANNFANTLIGRYRQIRTTTDADTRRRGPKKAAVAQNRSQKQIDRLFMITEQPGHAVHIATDPALFCAVESILTARFQDQQLPPAEREIATQLASQLLGSGEAYVAEHADELSQNSQYMRELLARYAFEMLKTPAIKGPAGHMLRGFFKTADTPERAVGRLNSVLESVVDGYDNRQFLYIVLSGIFAWRADFVFSSPVYENLMAASTAYHKPGLVADAIQLMQLPSLFLHENLSSSKSDTLQLVQRLQVTRATQRQRAISRVKTQGEKAIPNYRDLNEQYMADEDNMGSTAEAFAGHVRQVSFAAYLAVVGDVPGPIYTNLFLRPHELMQKYEQNIGHANLEGEAYGHTMVLNGDYVVDIIWPSAIGDDEEAKSRIKVGIIHKFFLDQDKRAQTLEQAQKMVVTNLALVNHRSSPIKLGEYNEDGAEDTPTVVRLRKRTRYDTEHTSPLDDFDLQGFSATQPVPELAATVAKIAANWTRVVPKRGIELTVTDEAIKHSGLTNLVMRSVGANHLIVNATIHGHQRLFQIKDNLFFDKYGKRLDETRSAAAKQFSNYCMHILGEWMCRPALETDEGTVQEGRVGPIKGGYFSYLRVRSEDGYKFRRGDNQWYAMVEDKGEDLDEQSARRAPQDPTGQQRNSTWYKLHADDGMHLPPLKFRL